MPGWINTIRSSEVSAVWRDPDFNPALKAFYCARAIKIPRWTC
ncbi:DUF3604 domain-containing protein [Sedimentitalea nanhaiensis]|nr:DUF3604 domain-containing protein [Sedimentitalea nanhaiensis]